MEKAKFQWKDDGLFLHAAAEGDKANSEIIEDYYKWLDEKGWVKKVPRQKKRKAGQAPLRQQVKGVCWVATHRRIHISILFCLIT
jgi:hypothetical protein